MSACVPVDHVNDEFKWVKTIIPDLGESIQEDPELYKIYSLNDEHMTRLLSKNFHEQGYIGWEPYQDSVSLSLHEPVYRLNGQTTPIQVCYKNDGSYKFNKQYNYIAMFVEMEKKRLVLVYGITFNH
jgi:hypothetical protein